MNNLPARWSEAPLTELCESIVSGRRPKGGVRGILSGVLSLGGEHIHERGFVDISVPRFVPRDFADKISISRILPNDILIVKDGATTGKTAIADNRFLEDEAYINEHIFLCRSVDEIISHYLFYFLRSDDGNQAILSDFRGAAQGGISQAFSEKIKVPIAPLAEQRRIVAKLDTLLARTRQMREELENIPSLIKQYKQAILAAAFRGELTADWRTKQSKKLTEWKTLPFSKVIDEGPQNGYSPPSSENSSGPLILRLTATTRGILDLSENAVKRVDNPIPSDSRFWLQPGDVLIQRGNSIDYVGVTAIFDGPENTYIYPDLMMRVRIGNPWRREYIWRYLNSQEARDYLRSRATGTAGNMPKINSKTLMSLTVPMPPDEEIAVIVLKLRENFAWLNSTLNEATSALRLLNHLEQATLAKAFRGELVPQDPNEEPASILLERIREARAEQSNNNTRKRRN